MKRMNRLMPAILVVVLGTSCQEKTDEVTTAKAKEVEKDVQKAVEAVNDLAVGYPTTLQLSIFPSGTSGASLTEEVVEKSFRKKAEEGADILKGTAKSCFSGTNFKQAAAPTEVTCYEFDSDMNPSKFGDSQREFGTVDGTNGKGEACLVTYMRYKVEESKKMVDQALELGQAMLCQAKVDADAKNAKLAEKDKVEVKRPGPNEVLDMSASMTKATGTGMPISSAKMGRLADVDGNPVFRTDIVLKDGSEVHIVHSPSAKENGEATGRVWFKRSNNLLTKVDFKPEGGVTNPTLPNNSPLPPLGSPLPPKLALVDPTPMPPPPPAGPPMVDANNSENKNEVMSINYEQVLDTDGRMRLRYQIRRASIAKTIEPFTKDGLVNFAGVPKTAANDTISGINYISFDVIPETSEGSFSYWMNPGGNYQESARGFVFDVEAAEITKIALADTATTEEDEDTKEYLLKGCGVSGATGEVSIRSEKFDLLKPVRYWHPRENQNVHTKKDPRYKANEGAAVTEQCFAQDETSKVYKVTTVDDRGYIVKEVAQVVVKGPKPPEKKFEGTFVPAN